MSNEKREKTGGFSGGALGDTGRRKPSRDPEPSPAPAPQKPKTDGNR